MDASHAFDPKLFASKIQNANVLPPLTCMPHQAKQLNHANKAAMSSEVVPKGYLNGDCGNLRKGVLGMACLSTDQCPLTTFFCGVSAHSQGSASS